MNTYNLMVKFMIAYTGGKTAGHVMPLISIIKENNEECIYVGFNNNIEEKICINNSIKFIGMKKYPNKMKSILLGYFYLEKVLKKYSISAILASGGFVSIPLCMYAIKHMIPLYLVEANVVLGVVNKLFYPFCKKIFLSYELNLKKGVLSGLPIRKIDEKRYSTIYDILIIGGSLGSKVLCDAAIVLKDEFRVILLAGNYYDEYKNISNITVIKYYENIYELMKMSKIIIARAGSSTSTEIFNINKPYVCIPSMNTKGNHQYLNALHFYKNNGCILCLESEIDTLLLDMCKDIINNELLIDNMKKAQNKMIVSNSTKIILEEIK